MTREREREHFTVLGQSLVKSSKQSLRFFNEIGILFVPLDSPMAIPHSLVGFLAEIDDGS